MIAGIVRERRGTKRAFQLQSPAKSPAPARYSSIEACLAEKEKLSPEERRWFGECLESAWNELQLQAEAKRKRRAASRRTTSQGGDGASTWRRSCGSATSRMWMPRSDTRMSLCVCDNTCRRDGL